jgi:hypothetical protein
MLYEEDCLDIYTECLSNIVVPGDDSLTTTDMHTSPWVVYSNNMFDCSKKLNECNELDKREL